MAMRWLKGPWTRTAGAYMLLGSHLTPDSLCKSAASGSVCFISQTEHGTTENESAERESEYPLEEDGTCQRGRSRLDRQDFHSRLQLPGSKQIPVQTCTVFFTPSLTLETLQKIMRIISSLVRLCLFFPSSNKSKKSLHWAQGGFHACFLRTCKVIFMSVSLAVLIYCFSLS